MGFSKFFLKNGLFVVCLYMPGKKSEAFRFNIHSGSFHDPEGVSGVAHLVEHLVSRNVTFNKNKGNLAYELIKDFILLNGGSVAFGTTGILCTHYNFSLPINRREKIRKMLSTFSDMLFSYNIEEEIEEQRKIVKEEFKTRYSEENDYNFLIKKYEILFRKFISKFAFSPSGNKTSIANITKEDINDFYNKNYCINNTTLFCVGGLKAYEIKEILNNSKLIECKKIGTKGKKLPIFNFDINIIPDIERKLIFSYSDHFKTNSDNFNKTHYEFSVIIPDSEKRIIFIVFRDMFNRILFQEFRTNLHWTYGVRSEFDRLFNFIVFTIKFNGINNDVVDMVEKNMTRCIDILINDNDLLEKTKKVLIAQTFSYDDTLNDEMRFVYNEQVFDLVHLTDNMFRKKVKNVTMDDMRFIANYFKEEYRVITITKP